MSDERRPYLNPRVAHIAALEKDWDSYGADPIDERALRVVDQISISPTSGGWVEVELTGTNLRVTVWVDRQGRISEVGTEIVEKGEAHDG